MDDGEATNPRQQYPEPADPALEALRAEIADVADLRKHVLLRQLAQRILDDDDQELLAQVRWLADQLAMVRMYVDLRRGDEEEQAEIDELEAMLDDD